MKRNNGDVSKAVIVCRPDGTEMEYRSGSAAAKAEGLTQPMVSQLCRNAISHRGFTVRFKDAQR
jgi:hypothetical protein